MAQLDVDSVLSKLSLQEKASLLSGSDFWHTQPLPQHGIPSLRLSDGPNGVRGTRFFNGVPASCFPCGTALGSTWDQPLLRRAGRLMGQEAVAKGAHVLLGPTVNMQRSPLGGRGFEAVGEDPVLSGLGAAALVSGVQEIGVVATVKHFVCNDQEHCRNRYDAVVSQRALREIYLLPFQIAVRDARPKACMTAYNKVNGTHASEHVQLLETVLRGEWGWDGLVMSDWFGTYSTAESINAGLDLEMPGPTRFRGDAATHAVASSKVQKAVLDKRARQVLKLVNECAASGIPENASETSNDTPETSALLRRLASESIVLLKNEDNVLPLKKNKKVSPDPLTPSNSTDTQQILLLGPNAATARFCGGGSASLRPTYVISPLEGIAEKVDPINLTYTIGAYAHKELPDLGPHLGTAPHSTGPPGVLFKAYNEPPHIKNRTQVDALVFQTTNMLFIDYKNPRLTTKLWYADIEGYFTPTRSGRFELGVCVYGSARVFVDGDLLIDVTEHQRQGSAFFELGTAEERAQFDVDQGKTYHIQVSFASAPTSKLKGGSIAFGGGAVKLGGAWVLDSDAEIAHATDLAKDADQVVICAGLNMDWESEGFDRDTMALPGAQDKLIASVAAANPNTVVVLQSGTPVSMPWLPAVKGVLQAWYGGNETGNGIADVLFGDVNPSGKLSVSWPVREEDNPAFLNSMCEGGRVLYGEDVYIGYRYYEMLRRPVAFPFGHGLSYTTFSFSTLCVDVSAGAPTSATLSVHVDVSNTGPLAGAQVIQIYVSQDAPSIRRPVKELKGFGKVFLEPAETRTVTVDVPLKYACSYFDEDVGRWVLERGLYKVLVSDSSEIGKGALEMGFEVQGETSWWGGL